jgi:hypothetical protein
MMMWVLTGLAGVVAAVSVYAADAPYDRTAKEIQAVMNNREVSRVLGNKDEIIQIRHYPGKNTYYVTTAAECYAAVSVSWEAGKAEPTTAVGSFKCKQ